MSMQRTKATKWSTGRGQKLWWAHWQTAWMRIGNHVRAFGGSCPWERLWPANDNRLMKE